MNESPATVDVQYFAAARELAGCEREQVALEQPRTSVAAFSEQLGRRHRRLAGYLPRMRFAVNGEFAVADQTIVHGDEVAVLPPVAGGSEAVWCALSESAPSVDDAIARVRQPGAGGIALFLGVVRDHADGKPVARLDYEAYDELALQEMRRILEALVEEHPGARIAALHRKGQLAVGDTAVVVAASAPHRDQAFAVCRAAIDRIKETVPIWKKEWAPDGSANWVNLA